MRGVPHVHTICTAPLTEQVVSDIIRKQFNSSLGRKTYNAKEVQAFQESGNSVRNKAAHGAAERHAQALAEAKLANGVYVYVCARIDMRCVHMGVRVFLCVPMSIYVCLCG